MNIKKKNENYLCKIKLKMLRPEALVLIVAMVNSNVPKFLSEDIPLFYAILTDLFPGIVLPKIENEVL